jgi:RNA polymerase sigma-70 factor, ECF subfamily
MLSAAQNDLHDRVKTLCGEGDYRAAATLIIREAGGDLVRVIYARFRDQQATAEIFSRFTEDMWRGLPSFAFRCALLVWLYTLCRNAGNRYLERELGRARRAVPLSQAPELIERAEAVRTATLTHLKSENRDRVRALRSSLSEEDQLLLTLRIDQGLEFTDIALVMLGDLEADSEAVRRESARLRKRLSLLKGKLRRLFEQL